MLSSLKLRKLSPREFRGRSVLIVDESPYTRKLVIEMCRALETRQVTTALTPADAIDMMQIVTFDFIVCHWTQPPLDGPRFVASVRASQVPAIKRIPILLLADGLEVENIEGGKTEVLRPPFSIQALAQKFEAIIL